MSDKKYFLGDKINTTNYRVVNELRNVNPKYAEHMYRQNRVVEAFAMSAFGGIDALDHPVCGKCEKPGMWTCDYLPGQERKECKECLENRENAKNAELNMENPDQYLKDIRLIGQGCCFCESCGTTTTNAVSMRDYLASELKLSLEQLQMFDLLQCGKEGNE